MSSTFEVARFYDLTLQTMEDDVNKVYTQTIKKH